MINDVDQFEFVTNKKTKTSLGDISSGKFCYCSSMKYGGNYKFIYIHIIKDLKYGKLKISSLKTLISSLAEFFGFLKTDKNLEVIFLAEFSGKTYNNTKELFTAINNSIDKALKNKGKKIPETPKGYF